MRFAFARTHAKPIGDAWHRFWYQPIDPIGICLLRIATGAMLLYSLAVWSLDLSSFFSYEQGWQTGPLVEHLQHGQLSFSFWWLIPDAYLSIAHAVAMAIAFAFMVGWQTRVTKIASFLICISYANRVPMAQFGFDQITAAWLLYLCLGPCGACLSVDRWWQRHRARKNASTAPPVERSSAARLTTRMIQVHICIIYLWAGLSKVQGDSWVDGTAVWWVASNYEHQQFSLTWLAYVPWLYQLATIGTWAWELSFAALIWNPKLRWPMLFMGMAMHIGIGLFLGLWPFALIMMLGYLSFAPPERLRHWINAAGEATSAKQRPATSAAPTIAYLANEAALHPTTEAAEIEQPAIESPAIESPEIQQPANDDAVIQLPVVDTDVTTRCPAADDVRTSEPRNPRLKMMIDDRDRNNMVLFVERSAKRRCSLIKALEDTGFRCIGLDAWPEAIEVYNALRPRCVMCNGYRIPNSELRFWHSQLQQRKDSRFVVLVDQQQFDQLDFNDEHTIAIPVPASFEQICEALGGKASPAANSTNDSASARRGQGADSAGDQIFSLTSHS